MGMRMNFFFYRNGYGIARSIYASPAIIPTHIAKV